MSVLRWFPWVTLCAVERGRVTVPASSFVPEGSLPSFPRTCSEISKQLSFSYVPEVFPNCCSYSVSLWVVYDALSLGVRIQLGFQNAGCLFLFKIFFLFSFHIFKRERAHAWGGGRVRGEDRES